MIEIEGKFFEVLNIYLGIYIYSEKQYTLRGVALRGLGPNGHVNKPWAQGPLISSHFWREIIFKVILNISTT